jgi:hypothetical protein
LLDNPRSLQIAKLIQRGRTVVRRIVWKHMIGVAKAFQHLTKPIPASFANAPDVVEIDFDRDDLAMY